MNPLAIDARDVSKSFDGKRVVNRLSMQVRRGEIFGFLGPNGSGKTTFIRMLCGLLKPDNAEGKCLGFDLLREQHKIKRRVGYMTQKFSLYDDLSVEENLDFMARLHEIPERKKTIAATIEEYGLSGRSKQLAGTLSGGWKQRLSLAASLLHKPELLLLDEPTAGVDPKARREFWERLHELAAKDSLTVLITTHFMDEAERCHRLAYIAYGKLLATGTVKEVIAASQLKTWELEGADSHSLIAKLEGCPGVMQVAAFGNALHVSGVDAQTLESTIAPFAKDYSARQVPTSLEDVFIHLMESTKDNYQ
jgi:ABC-2 type transport system ATP-binding protein